MILTKFFVSAILLLSAQYLWQYQDQCHVHSTKVTRVYKHYYTMYCFPITECHLPECYTMQHDGKCCKRSLRQQICERSHYNVSVYEVELLRPRFSPFNHTNAFATLETTESNISTLQPCWYTIPWNTSNLIPLHHGTVAHLPFPFSFIIYFWFLYLVIAPFVR
jgi:hypothetical protein